MATPDLQALLATWAKPQSPSAKPSQTTRDPLTAKTNGVGHEIPKTSSLPPSPTDAIITRDVKDDSWPQELPNTVPQGDGSKNNDRVQSLLSLLNFGQAGAAGQGGRGLHAVESSTTAPDQQNLNRAVLSASDLAPNFMPNPGSAVAESQSQTSAAVAVGSSEHIGVAQTQAHSESQDALLRLLSQSRCDSTETPEQRSYSPSHYATSASGLASIQQSQASKLDTNYGVTGDGNADHQAVSIRLFGTARSREITPFEPLASEISTEQKSNTPLFTYRNPFDALNASRYQTAKSQRVLLKSGTPPPKSTIIGTDVSSQQAGPEKRYSSDGSLGPNPVRRKLTPKSSILILEPAALVGSTFTKRTDTHDEPGKSSVEIKIEESEIGKGEDALSDVPKEVPGTDTDHKEQLPERPSVPHSQAAQEPGNEQDGAEPADLWESADDSPTNQAPKRQVPVYNFPIKPFISVTLQPGPTSKVTVREDGVMEISRLKKDFDQQDRSLAAATSKYISYALIKSGGLRIIRQDDGSDRQVFKNSHDRIFNVAFCTTASNGPPTDHQAVLGTGVSGSVYYATVIKEGFDLFEENMLDVESLIFPPHPGADENTSCGVLRTRVKKSSRHPEFFAIGRGKNIHIIWPATAISPKYGVQGKERRVDVENFYRERSLAITTGKAGKDFTFSEDDTVIASLDKAGRLRFWDIRTLVDQTNAKVDTVSAVDIDTPLLSLSIASASEKPWPTSVHFVDKIRPYLKGSALRYNLVGLKQNHTLQLWDIALGKAVQELNFPRQTETDAICSVSYHPTSGIIVVGHPTRNSIYLIHLSAPKYTLPHMSQAIYTRRLASKDPDLPRPESTAVMSGIREMSFATRGQLRSVELLSIHNDSDVSKSNADSLPLFELYVVHSKGVTCVSIAKEDLGWNSGSKILHPIDAVDAGVATLKELRLGSIINESLNTKADEEEPNSPGKDLKKKSNASKTELSTVETEGQHHSGASRSGLSKAEADTATRGTKSLEANDIADAQKMSKKVKKKLIAANQTSSTKDVSFEESGSNKQASSKPKALDCENEVAPTRTAAESYVPVHQPESLKRDISGDWLDKELRKIEKGVAREFRKELDKLYHDIQSDRNVQDSAAVARHEAVLRLVSSMLSTNVENSLARIINTQIQQVVIPSLNNVTVPAIVEQIGESIAKIIHHLVPREMTTHLPVAISAALQQTQLSRTITEMVSQVLTTQVETQFSDLLQNSITPSFRNLAISAANQAAAEVEGRLGARLRQTETERRHDSNKIDQLNKILHGIAETMQAMSDSQVAFQDQIWKDRRHVARIPETGFENTNQPMSTVANIPTILGDPVPAVVNSPQEAEIEEVSELMAQGKYENGTIKWLQSAFQVELFDDLFVRYTPDYLISDVSPLVAFSVAITVANSLQTYTARRLEWVDAAFDAVDFEDPELADLSRHAPALLDSLIQKLENKYVATAEHSPTDHLLQLIPPITQKARDMKRAVVART